MTAAHHMLQISLDSRKLTKWALDRRLDASDTGYAAHALLCDAFGDARPQPYTAEDKTGRVKILGYGAYPETELNDRLARTAEPEAVACVMSVASKQMPSEWEAGKRYAFQIRVAPTRQGHRDDGRRREADAIFFAPGGADRGEVYRAWLDERFGDAAVLETCNLRSFRLFRACRRGITEGGKRPAMSVTLPDASFDGVLQVRNPSAFAAVIRHGLGRHRQFGFGALLLRPIRGS